VNKLRVLVTRPQPQADAWVRRLRDGGVDAHALPLLAIEPAPADTLAALWHSLPSQSLLVFVSPNAVSSFFAARPPGAAWPAGLVAASPGPGSDAELAAAGVAERIAPAADAEQFDSESLWQQLRGRAWPEVTVVRGDGGRELLAERLHAAGSQVRAVQAYRRLPPQWGAKERALYAAATAAPAQHVWLLSSTQALAHLPPLPAGRADWQACASHPRIADAARAQGWGHVTLLRPGLPALQQALNRIGAP
jgi:uroporphyrinogen-III synthase